MNIDNNQTSNWANKNMKIALGVVLLLIIGLVGYRFLNSPTEVQSKFKIGVILPLTGPAPSLGESGKNSVELALTDLDAKVKEKIEIIYEDDALDTKKTVAAVHKLINIDKVNALVTFSSASSIAASHIAEQKQVPLIGIGIAKEINDGKKWVLRFMPSPDKEAVRLEALLLKGKYKKVSIISNKADGPKAFAEAVAKAVTENGYELVANESVEKTSNDFKTTILKVKSANPDVLVNSVFPQSGLLAKQIKDIGWDIPIVGYVNMEDGDQVRIAEGRFENQLIVGHDNFVYAENYQKVYNILPGVAGDHVYDAVARLTEAVSVGKTTNTEIIDFLAQDFKGAAGQYLYLGNHAFDADLVVKTYSNGAFKKID